MAAPHDCPIPTGQACPHLGIIQTQESSMRFILERLNELRDDLRSVKTAVAVITKLEQDHSYAKEAMSRAFDRIGALEKHREEHEAVLQQAKGAKITITVLWAITGTTVGALASAFVMYLLRNAI